MAIRLLLVMVFIAGLCFTLIGWLWPEAGNARAAIFASITAVMALLPLWVVNRQNAASFDRISRQSETWSQGELAGRVYVDGPSNIRSLALQLNTTAERLGGRMARLEEDRSRMRAILSGMIEGVIALDAAQQVIFANERAGTLLDFSPVRAAGLKFWEVVRQRVVQQVVEDALARRAPSRNEFEWPGKTSRSLAIYAAPLPGDEAAGLIVVVHDLSELRRLERLRQEFVANVSHELKTPLSVIKACTETLLDGAADDAAHRKSFLEQIDDQSDRLHALIIDLLNIARLESGQAMFEIVQVRLAEVAADCVDRHLAIAKSKSQQLRLQTIAGDDSIQVFADSEAVETILDNLLDNAIKYTPEGGSISVGWGSDGDTAWIEVADSGIGIPEADLPRVFERFYRVDKARSREMGGTGLGLSIVKHLVQSMNGAVAARSAEGQGSIFTVRLPVASVS